MFFVSEKVWREREGSFMFVCVNIEVIIEDFICGIIVVFGNDVCIVVVEGILGIEDEFLYFMIEFVCKMIGLKKFIFGNFYGMFYFDIWMIVEDLVILVKFIIDNYFDFYKYFFEKEF